jgi:hypothetical protein
MPITKIKHTNWPRPLAAPDSPSAGPAMSLTVEVRLVHALTAFAAGTGAIASCKHAARFPGKPAPAEGRQLQ